MKNKLFFLLIMLLATAAIISCAEPEDLKIEGNEKIFTDFEGVYLTLEGIGEASISVTWHNDTDEEITFGEGYSIEILTSTGEWTSVQKEEMSVPAIALLLMPKGETRKGYFLSFFDLSRVGKYRLRCEFRHGGNTYNTWVEFMVTEENTAEVNRIPGADLSGFSDFLDREGFVKGMSQGQLLDLAEKYAEDLDPSIVPVYCHYDGEFGGGCMASGELFGYTNDYHSKDGKVRYANSLYTAVEIKGLALPGGITFDDSVGDALEKLGIDRNIYQKTVMEHSSTTYLEQLPLYNENGVSLVFTNWAMTQLPVETLYHYVITYSEKVGTVTRTVTLSFLDGHNKLGLVEISVVDEYER